MSRPACRRAVRLPWGALTLGLLLLLPSLAAAQTTGDIEGLIHDRDNHPLANATVTLTSPSLQGERVARSDPNGRFRLPTLPPGGYRAVAALEGYNPVEVPGIRVSLDRTVTLDLTLSPIVGEEMWVTAASPAVDLTGTTTGVEFAEKLMRELPIATRSFTDLAFLAPGVTDGGLEDNPSIRGASAAENRYVVDGLDVTDPGFGTVGATLPVEFLEEVQVKTGGYEPEYGGALGGVLNLVTRSGGNELRGDLFAHYSADDLEASSPASERAGQRLGATRYDVGLDVGGKILRDRLWYFLALDLATDRQGSANLGGQRFTEEEETLFYAAKLTWQIDGSQRLVASAFGNPIDRTDVPASFSTGRLANNREEGGDSLGLGYSASPRPHLLVEATAGRFERVERQTPLRDVPWYQDVSGSGLWANPEGCGDPVAVVVSFTPGCEGGSTVIEDRDRTRDQARASLAWFAGDHAVQGGVEIRRLRFIESERYPGPSPGPLIDSRGTNFDPDGITGGFFRVFSPEQCAQLPAPPGCYTLSSFQTNSLGRTDEAALYVQDSWAVSPRLTLNLGVRLDALEARGNQTAVEPDNRLDFGLGEMVAPRLGFAWDPTGTGRSKLFGSFGRFYEAVPLSLNVFQFGSSGGSTYFLAHDGSLPSYDNLGTFFFSTGSSGDEMVQATVDPDLDPMFTEEWVLGIQYEVIPGLVLGLSGVYRELGDVVEDISVDEGQSFYVTNPGGRIEVDPITGETLAEPVVFPRAVREYRAAELTVERRASDWQLSGSYVYSENEGNYVGLYLQDYGQLSPNLGQVFDFADLLVGSYGQLPNDRPHHLKAYGSYRWPFRLQTGFFAEYASGTPMSKVGPHTPYGQRFVAPRGTAGRTPGIWRLDLRLDYLLKVGKLDALLVADVFNVTNERRPTELDEFWNLSPLQQALDPNECGGPGTGPGTDCPTGNPFWGTPLDFQAPRSVRLGVRLSWPSSR